MPLILVKSVKLIARFTCFFLYIFVLIQMGQKKNNNTVFGKNYHYFWLPLPLWHYTKFSIERIHSDTKIVSFASLYG